LKSVEAVLSRLIGRRTGDILRLLDDEGALQKPKSLFVAAIIAAISIDARIGTTLSSNISAFSEPLGEVAISPSTTF